LAGGRRSALPSDALIEFVLRCGLASKLHRLGRLVNGCFPAN
jgi:hypothetical protein